MKSTMTVRKWDNSLAVRLPKSITDDLSLTDASQIVIISNGKTAVIAPLSDNQLLVDELVARINPINSRALEDWGKSVGRELW